MPAPKKPASLFGRRLREARLAAGLSQAELGARLGLDEQNTGAPRVSRYETGLHQPDPQTAEELGRILGVPTAYFHAASDVLAEAILVIARMPVKKQKEALEKLKVFAAQLDSE